MIKEKVLIAYQNKYQESLEINKKMISQSEKSDKFEIEGVGTIEVLKEDLDSSYVPTT